MNKRFLGTIGVVASALFLAIAAAAAADKAPKRWLAPSRESASHLSQPGLIDFERQIQPIITDRCLECHSQDKRKGGLSLATYGDVLDGGKDGAIVRPGQSARSMIIAKVKGEQGDRMPLDELPLSDTQIALLQRWIDEGARATPASAAAPPPWEAPLALTAPDVPPLVWPAWQRPADDRIPIAAGKG